MLWQKETCSRRWLSKRRLSPQKQGMVVQAIIDLGRNSWERPRLPVNGGDERFIYLILLLNRLEKWSSRFLLKVVPHAIGLLRCVFFPLPFLIFFIYHACHCGSLIKQLVCGSTQGMDFKMSAMKLPWIKLRWNNMYKFSQSLRLRPLKRNLVFFPSMLRNLVCDRVKQADFDAKALQPPRLLPRARS